MMKIMKQYPNKIILSLLVCFLLLGCTEQYVMQTNTFEEALVVEATLTNELKTQTIKISRTYRFEQNGPVAEVGADVTVLDDQGNQYAFEESNGKYVSVSEFQAVPGRIYRLNIVTQDGKTYNSSGEELTPINEMQSVVPTVQVKDGDKGVAIMVNSYDPSGQSKYYRYEYEETYKVIAPEWNPDKTILLPPLEGGSNPEIGIVPRTNGETKTCYSTHISNEILQTTTVNLNEDRVNYPVRFISTKNYIITHRYSILVRQYVQNLASYTFYKILKQLSGNGGILSQSQPGFFYGNLRCVTNPNEKVVGFFEVASVSSKRIFFNYTDLFPADPLPPYFADCELREYGFCFIATNPDCKGALLLSAIGTNDLLYAGDFFSTEGGFQVYQMVLPACGDCTRFSSNVIPTFWTE
jgi:uncharacterized protein DUF4249